MLIVFRKDEKIHDHVFGFFLIEIFSQQILDDKLLLNSKKSDVSNRSSNKSITIRYLWITMKMLWT